MSENMNELHELDELKATYNLMDERLDGQEIVSEEQLREAMCRNFSFIRQSTKDGIIWSNLVCIPILAWYFWVNGPISTLSLVVLGLYWLASLVFRFFVLKRIRKSDYGNYDLKTLLEQRARYNKNMQRFGIISMVSVLLLFILFFGEKGRGGAIAITIMLLTVLVPTVIRKLVIKYRYGGQSIDPATGSPRKLGGKYSLIAVSVFMGLSILLVIAGTVIDITRHNGISSLLYVVNAVSIIIAVTTFLLGIFHMRKKITVSRRLLVILTILAILLSLSAIGISMQLGIAEFANNPNILLGAACISTIGLSFQRMRK